MLADDGTIGYADNFVFTGLGTFRLVMDEQGIYYIVPRLNDYVFRFAYAIKEGEDEIRQILLEAGYSEEQVNNKLDEAKPRED